MATPRALVPFAHLHDAPRSLAFYGKLDGWARFALAGLLAGPWLACARQSEPSAGSVRRDVAARRASAPPRITRADLERLFAQMRQQSGLNVDGPLLWGYFFTDRDPSRLKPLADHLASLGYRVVDIYPTDDGSTTFLHVEKVESHSAASLDERNASFYALAVRFGVETYDGMDVGPTAPPR